MPMLSLACATIPGFTRFLVLYLWRSIMEQDHEGGLWPLAADVACLPQPIVNLYFVGRPDSGDRGWTLIDAGLPGTARWTRRAAEARFGPGARPAAIIL